MTSGFVFNILASNVTELHFTTGFSRTKKTAFSFSYFTTVERKTSEFVKNFGKKNYKEIDKILRKQWPEQRYSNVPKRFRP